MTNKAIFCNVPWYELHIYQDGTYGTCCSESHPPTLNPTMNVATHTIQQWFQSAYMDTCRLAVLGDQPVSFCSKCYETEKFGGDSRRIANHYKSAIFPHAEFHQSYLQSPGFRHFEHSTNNHGQTSLMPVDLHIDLGNWCNLACKMCNAKNSTTIASQEVKWGIESSKRYLGSDWTRDTEIWQRFVSELLTLPKVKNIHFMGGETLMTDRLENLVDAFIEAGRFETCFSFVTNGTIYKPILVEKLKLFQRVGFEISIETADHHNSYVRQGTDTAEVISNIRRYHAACNGSSVSVTLRPALNLLTIGYYHTLLQFALDHGFLIKNSMAVSPSFLQAKMLPHSVKNLYLDRYRDLQSQLQDLATIKDYNTSDPNQYRQNIARELHMAVSILQTSDQPNMDQELQAMVAHCRRWDSVYGFNARELYPELNAIWNRYGY